MKPGRVAYPPDPRLWSSEAHEIAYNLVLEQSYKLLLEECQKVEKDMFRNDLLYGASGCHVSEDGEIQRLDPMSVEDIIRSRNIKDMQIQKLTLEEIIERYPELTEEQITKLKEYGK